MTDSLSIQQARKLVLLSQRLPSSKKTGGATEATLSAIEHLGYVQIDTISVVERAHHHTLWNRNPRYDGSQLDQLVADRRVFEYWSHAAAYLPMRDFRFSLLRKQAIATGAEKHWHVRDSRLIRSVLRRIADEGPLMARDFEHNGKKTSDWSSKPARRALESLFMQGELMASHRVNFHKVYDLPERVLPAGTDTTMPSPEEYGRYLVTRFLRANGLGQPGEIAYLLKNTRPLISSTLQDMVAGGEVHEIRVGDQVWYALPESLELLSRPLARSRVKILSPFDNLVIQRERLRALFAFDYLIECYVPKAKRRYGYFSLPVLWDGRLVARMDCKAERKDRRLHLNHVVLEPWLSRTDAFFVALRKELEAFLTFNGCERLRLHRIAPSKHKAALRTALRELIG